MGNLILFRNFNNYFLFKRLKISNRKENREEIRKINRTTNGKINNIISKEISDFFIPTAI